LAARPQPFLPDFPNDFPHRTCRAPHLPGARRQNAGTDQGRLLPEDRDLPSAKARFGTLVALSDSDDRARAIIGAMESIEGDYDNLAGVLPKSEYQEPDSSVLGQLLRMLNPDDSFAFLREHFCGMKG
jgi:hypothetical protein